MANPTGFLRSAVTLSAAAAITRVLGALYKIPLGNALGAQGMAHFTVAYNIYNACLLLVCAGLPTVLCRQVAGACALGQANRARRIFSTALTFLTLLGVGSGAVLFFFPGFFAGILHDPSAGPAIRMLSLSLMCMGAVSALRAVTQGRGNMLPTAVSQLIEAVSKLVFGLWLAFAALRRGAAAEAAASAALAGVSIGTAAALLYLWGHYRRHPLWPGYDVPPRRSAVLRQLCQGAVPITAAAAGMSLITLLDQTLILSTLQHSLGYTAAQAAEQYGEYTFSMTLFALPPGIVMTLSVSLMPAVSAALARKETRAASSAACMAVRLTFLAALPMGVGLSVMAEPLLLLFYPAQAQTARAAAYHLSVLGLASVFVCLMAVTNGILQAYGRERFTVFSLLCGGALKIAANRLMVANPAIGIRGAAAGTLSCYALIVLLNAMAIRRCTAAGIDYFSLAWRPVIAVIVMALAASSSCAFLSSRCSPAPAVLLSVFFAAAVYTVLLFSLGALQERDLHCLFAANRRT